jgi:putative transposase
MRRSRFTEEQIIGILREQAASSTTADVYYEHATSPATLCSWKAKFGGLEISQVRTRLFCRA